MGSFDDWAHRHIRKSQRAKKYQQAQPNQGNSNLNSKQWPSSAVWAIKNPDMAKYDNDGNPVDPSHWS
jgi:hypothetical protein